VKFRKHVRLKDYDYSTNGYYFVTMCCSRRAKLCLKYKTIIEKYLKNLEKHDSIKLDYCKLMPEHLHLILILDYPFGKANALPLHRYIQDFKSKTTLEIKKNGFVGKRFWQPNYYEHIIRNENALDKIRRYIEYNPDIEKPNWDKIERLGLH